MPTPASSSSLQAATRTRLSHLKVNRRFGCAPAHIIEICNDPQTNQKEPVRSNMDTTMIPAKPSDAPFAASSQSEWIWSRVEGLDRTLLLDDRNSSIRGTTNDPCLIAVKNASGIWIFDHAGRRYMDMYGNNCHHIGYNHPRLIAALREQMDELSFVPRGL